MFCSRMCCQKRIIKCIGLKELVYGIPFISAIFKYWKAFEFSSSISIIENRSFYHCVELLSCQALLSAAYFRTISEVISSADLHLTSVQLEKECVRLFPNIIADDPIRSCGRRLILLAGTEFEITSRSEDPNVVTISQLRVTSGTLNDISAFLKTRFDIHSITESLFVDVGNLVKLLFSAALNDYFGFTPPPETSFAFIDQFVSDLNMVYIEYISIIPCCLCDEITNFSFFFF